MPFKTIEIQKKEIGNVLSKFAGTTVTLHGNACINVYCDNDVVAGILAQHFAKDYQIRFNEGDVDFYIDLVEPTITIAELAQKITKFNEAYPQYSTSTMDAFVDFLGMERPQ